MGEQIGFGPRRLGHANLYVGELERSMAFYNEVVGLEEVFREPAIHAGFLSNGNTHHDIGMVEIQDTRILDDRILGSDQPRSDPKTWGRKPGINHLAFEMENEAELVVGYERARAASVDFRMTVDHKLSRSVYLFDPDGNGVEFYADSVKDWRAIFEAFKNEVITDPWVPGDSPPVAESFYPVDPEIQRAKGAIFHPSRITHAVLSVANFDDCLRFYAEVGGLQVVHSRAEAGVALLRGKQPRHGYDLALVQATHDRPPGLLHMAFEIEDEADLEAAEGMLSGASLEVTRRVDVPSKRSIFLEDPDGLGVEFYFRRDETYADLEPHLI